MRTNGAIQAVLFAALYFAAEALAGMVVGLF